MNALHNYYNWLDGLDSKKRQVFQFIMVMIHDWSNERRKELWQQYNFRRHFAFTSGKYKNIKTFLKAELYRASEELTRAELPCDWDFLSLKLSKLKNDIDLAKKENRFTYIIDYDDEYEILYKDVLMNAHLLEEYLNTNIDTENPGSFWQLMEKIKYSEKMVDLLGRFYWLGDLINIIESGEHPLKEKSAIQFPPFPECFINKDDFKKYINHPRVEELYFTDEEGKYHLKTGRKSSIAGFAHNLKIKKKLIDTIKTNQDLAKVVCDFFHESYNKIEEKQFQPERAKIDEFSFIK